MLFVQDLRRRHECSLETGFYRKEHRGNRNTRLAGANIALQQTVHRLFAPKITTQLADHAGLRARQIEWQTSQKFLEQGARAAMRLSAAGSGGRSARCDQKLHRKELGKD